MLFLNHLIKLRNQTNPEEEKPFLDHLEDLRSTVLKMVLTLLVATIACFGFRAQLMDILRAPVDRMWEEHQKSQLPPDLSFADWSQAHTIAQAATGLTTFPPEIRQDFWKSITNPELRRIARALLLYQATQSLPPDARTPFLEASTPPDSPLRSLTQDLLAYAPPLEIQEKGDLRFMSSFRPTETFMLSMKLAFFAGLIISFPLLLLFLLEFILPGLHHNERKALWPALLVGFGLFLGGVFFAYFIILPTVLDFFFTYGSDLHIQNDWRIGYYISFVTQFVLIFGLAFELPVVVMTLVHLGLLSFGTMHSSRSYAIIAILITAAIITPTPDIPTLLLLAGPMYLLYEICIWLAYLLEKRQERRERQGHPTHRPTLGDSLPPDELDPLSEGPEDDDHGDPLTDQETTDLLIHPDAPLLPPDAAQARENPENLIAEQSHDPDPDDPTQEPKD